MNNKIEKSSSNNLHELKSRLMFVFIALLVFRACSYIPVPGVNPAVLAHFIESQKGTIVDVFNVFSGGALTRASLLSLGIMPYISASIIVQLLAVVSPTLSELKKEGTAGRKKLTDYTRYATLALATLQATGLASTIPNMMENLVNSEILDRHLFVFVATVSLVTGTIFLMWLGEQITQRGIGNGISLIIFAGIVSRVPSGIGSLFEGFRLGEYSFFLLPIIALASFAIIYFVVFMERGQRRITISYAKNQQNRRAFAPQTTHLPLKINMAGVIPAIFASSIILFPATIAQWFGNGQSDGAFSWLLDVSLSLNPGQPLHMILYALAILFFCFFYTALVFNPRETAENLKKSGAFISGIRPGEKTAQYIDKVMTRITLWGALYIILICLIPEFVMAFSDIRFYFGGTSILIVVVVIMDFMTQVQTHLMSQHYESALKKANLKSGIR